MLFPFPLLRLGLLFALSLLSPTASGRLAFQAAVAKQNVCPWDQVAAAAAANSEELGPDERKCWSGLFDSDRQGAAFDAREATIADIHDALRSGRATCRDVVSSHLARIEAFNSQINAIISLNADALNVADKLDRQLQDTRAVQGALFCVPVMLKDNFDAVGMPTTAGCAALADLWPTEDAPTVRRLKAQGAVIMGKTNLHEMALEGLSVSSLGGQTLNPYDLTRTPGGSSGGSGVALAASFCVIALGTDTMNSLRSPASANSLFSIRPTRGIIDTDGVVPVSLTQDAVGPMARTVRDLAVAFEVMLDDCTHPAGDDSTKPCQPLSFKFDPPKEPLREGLKGKRFGVIETFFDRTGSEETSPVNDVVEKFFAQLEQAGAELVPVNESFLDPARISSLDVQRYEFRALLTEYLSSPSRPGQHPRSFDELYSRQQQGDHLVIPAQRDFIRAARTSGTHDGAFAAKRAAARRLRADLDALLERRALDFLLYPQQRNLVVRVGAPAQRGRNGHLAVLTASPSLTLPAGFSAPDAPDAPGGVPVGVEMLGRRRAEAELFRTAAVVEAVTAPRRPPETVDFFVPFRVYDRVPTIKPNGTQSMYPKGVH